MPSNIFAACLLATALFLFACAATPEARVAQAKRQILKQPFEQWPSLYAKYEKKGAITQEVRKEWMPFFKSNYYCHISII
jgi:hypothetical protein